MTNLHSSNHFSRALIVAAVCLVPIAAYAVPPPGAFNQPVVVQRPPSKPDAVDLAVTNITVNDMCQVVIEISNVGSKSIDAGTRWIPIQLTDGQGNGIGARPFDASTARDPGTKASLVWPWTLLVNGNLTVHAHLDGGAAGDTSPANDSRSAPLTCTPANVRMADIELDAKCRIQFTVRNDGPTKVAPAPSPTVTITKSDGAPPSSWALPGVGGLAVGASVTGPGPFVSSKLPVTVTAAFDPSGQFPDAKRSDNILTKQLTCSPKAQVQGPTGATLTP
jgi:hypothetical protein